MDLLFEKSNYDQSVLESQRCKREIRHREVANFYYSFREAGGVVYTTDINLFNALLTVK